jgi:signal transduction histidine kinase
MHADPTRMTECFDELFANALHWLDKPQKRISILIDRPKKKDVPPELDGSKKYIRIRFEDNGPGVPPKMKKEIFAPFCTTHPHGTGLGLSMVERIIQGHDGLIREIGTPGESAIFEIFLPEKSGKH